MEKTISKKYFTPSSNSYSRIDYFLVSNQLFPQICDVRYETIVISDRVEWPYLFDMLCRYGCGPKLCQWIKLLYCEPLAEIVTNNLISEPFNLLRGNHPGIKGIYISGQEHHISLFADYILLYLTDLKNTLPTLINMINHFGTFSGLPYGQPIQIFNSFPQ